MHSGDIQIEILLINYMIINRAYAWGEKKGLFVHGGIAGGPVGEPGFHGLADVSVHVADALGGEDLVTEGDDFGKEGTQVFVLQASKYLLDGTDVGSHAGKIAEAGVPCGPHIGHPALWIHLQMNLKNDGVLSFDSFQPILEPDGKPALQVLPGWFKDFADDVIISAVGATQTQHSPESA